MARHIVLLRGINVGRHNRIAMAEFKALLTDLGYTEVRTLLNSGNAVVTTPDADSAAVARRIQKAISDSFGLSIAVMVRSRAQVESVIARNPMPEEAERAPSYFHVGFCDPAPPQERLDSIDATKLGADRIMVRAGTCYLWFADGPQNSPLGKAIRAHKLGANMTMRSWNTVRKLVSLAGPVGVASDPG